MSEWWKTEDYAQDFVKRRLSQCWGCERKAQALCPTCRNWYCMEHIVAQVRGTTCTFICRGCRARGKGLPL